jgi:hypothetical protein
MSLLQVQVTMHARFEVYTAAGLASVDEALLTPAVPCDMEPGCPPRLGAFAGCSRCWLLTGACGCSCSSCTSGTAQHVAWSFCVSF